MENVVKVKCPICDHTEEIELKEEAPECPNCFMQMIVVELSHQKQV